MILISKTEGNWDDYTETPDLLFESKKTLEQLQVEYKTFLLNKFGDIFKLNEGKYFKKHLKIKVSKSIKNEIRKNSFYHWLAEIEEVQFIEFEHCVI